MSAPAMLDYFTLVRVLKLVEASSDKEQMQKGANDARSDDVKRITSFVGTWLNEDRDRPELRVFDHTRNATITNADGEAVVTEQRAPILNPGDRSTRGIQHDITGALLTPTHWDWSEARCGVYLCGKN
jgi:hypothetical protein